MASEYDLRRLTDKLEKNTEALHRLSAATEALAAVLAALDTSEPSE